MSSHHDTQIALSVQQVSALLKVSRNTTYALIRNGSLRSIRVGRQIRVPRAALEDFLGRSA